MPNVKAESHGLVRVIEESGADYLYPADFLVSTELPREAAPVVAVAQGQVHKARCKPAGVRSRDCDFENASAFLQIQIAGLEPESQGLFGVCNGLLLRISRAGAAWDLRKHRRPAPAESKYPVIVTTSRLRSTGVDAQTCRPIVLDREVASMTEFKQIVGRGTRVHKGPRGTVIAKAPFVLALA